MMRDDAYLDDLSQMFHIYRLGVDYLKQYPFHRVPMGVAITWPEAQRIKRIFLCTISSLIAAIVSYSTVGLRHCHHSTISRTLIYKIFTYLFPIKYKNTRRTFRTIRIFKKISNSKHYLFKISDKKILILVLFKKLLH